MARSGRRLDKTPRFIKYVPNLFLLPVKRQRSHARMQIRVISPAGKVRLTRAHLQLGAKGAKILELDLLDEKSIVQAAEDFGHAQPLDILINVAGT